MHASVGSRFFQYEEGSSIFNILSPPLKNGKRILCERLGVQVVRKQVPIRGGKAKGAVECRNKLSFWQGLMDNRSTSLFFLMLGDVCTVSLLNLCYMDFAFSCNGLIKREWRSWYVQITQWVDLQQSTSTFLWGSKLDQTKTHVLSTDLDGIMPITSHPPTCPTSLRH